MTIRELFALCDYSAGDFNAVMPLTTTVRPEKPEDVIGFAWQSIDDEQPTIMTLPGREWETTAEYTGLDAGLYKDCQVDRWDTNEMFLKLVESPVIAFSKGVAAKAFGALHFSPIIIGLPEALAKTTRRLKPPEDLTIRSVASWLNSGRPLLKMSRMDCVKALKFEIDRRDGVPIAGFNLAADLGMFDKLLMREVTDPLEPSDESE